MLGGEKQNPKGKLGSDDSGAGCEDGYRTESAVGHGYGCSDGYARYFSGGGQEGRLDGGLVGG